MEDLNFEKELNQVKWKVIDTTYIQDERLRYFAGNVMYSVEKFVNEHHNNLKTNSKEITFEKETSQFITDLKAAIEKYATNFAQIKEVMVVKDDLVKEYDELTARMQRLEADPDIKYSEAKKEAQVIRERQLKLQNFYKQVEQQESKSDMKGE